MPEEEDQGTNQTRVKVLIDNLRPKLLDITSRNPLISTKFSPRSNSYIRVVDQLPDLLWRQLDNDQLDNDQQPMRLISLPGLDEDPRDEQSLTFRNTFASACQTDEDYLAAMNEVQYNEVVLEQKKQVAKRELKDRIRKQLDMHPRQIPPDICLETHAKNNGISPSYDLPKPNEEHIDGRHSNGNIQTLLLPGNFEQKLNNLNTKCRASMQETGINALHAAFGFLEWIDPGSPGTTLFSPLVLAAVGIQKNKTPGGPEFLIRKTGDGAETNMAFAEMLRIRFQIEIPEYNGGSIEEYFEIIAEQSPPTLRWKIRRWVALGVFPYARMAMYYDLDTTRNAFYENEVVGNLLGGSSATGVTLYADDYEIDQPEIEKEVPYLVMNADSSQFSALVDIAKGKNLAIEGPPGTGKSQTIVNAIAAAISNDKKVLFVAEKAAALEVVKSRLEAIGLGEFILPLQAKRSARETVIKSVRDRLNMEITKLSPQDYTREVEKFKQSRTKLDNYIKLITSDFGESEFTIHEILGKGICYK